MKRARINLVIVALAALGSGAAEAATLTVADISTTEVTEVTQAASASVTTLNALAKTKIDLSRATRSGFTTQLSALQTYLNDVGAYITMVKADTRAERKAAREAAEIALQAQEKALEANNQAIAAMKEEAGQRYQTAMDAAVRQMQLALVAVDILLKADLSALNVMRTTLLTKIDEIDQQIDLVNQQMKKFVEASEKLRRMEASKDAAVKTIENANADAADAKNTALCFTRISQDTTQAATLAAAIRNNLSNLSGFASALKTICNFPELTAQEVREATGLVTVFRTARLTHCISTKAQCSAKAYSVSP